MARVHLWGVSVFWFCSLTLARAGHVWGFGTENREDLLGKGAFSDQNQIHSVFATHGHDRWTTYRWWPALLRFSVAHLDSSKIGSEATLFARVSPCEEQVERCHRCRCPSLFAIFL